MWSGKATLGDKPKVVFLFTGQGSQYVEMGRRLYETELVFRQALEKCSRLLEPYLKQPLLSVLYPEAGVESPIDETAYTQPALFALEYALAELWRSWGLEPAAVIGHSVGEYVAACVAGVFSLEDGLKLIAERGRLMQALPRNGAMAAIFADEAEVRAAIAPRAERVSIAAINGPNEVVISGTSQEVKLVLQEFRERDIKVRPLTVSHAFHSPLMEPILDQFERVAGQIQFKPPQIPLVSNISGQLFKEGAVPDARYWRRHIREAVRFEAGIRSLYEQGYRLFVEIGPQPILSGLGQRCLVEGKESGSWFASLRKGRNDWQQMLETVGSLYLQGLDIRWAEFHRDYASRRLALPLYPFQRQRYWIETNTSRTATSAVGTYIHPLLGQRLRLASKEIIFETPGQ